MRLNKLQFSCSARLRIVKVGEPGFLGDEPTVPPVKPLPLTLLHAAAQLPTP